ncbi:sensor histidine kinase [Cryobacterium shii]|uniref:ATP-binding protein n=1 Tax=Cryobacterium shii TaxID=1259235 RepID=A0AAQ2C629_9MICO|nr:ATP-binding protein [Cryobacterium shii]TFC47178.1 ATP-binding protein [Cryobacterium shii]
MTLGLPDHLVARTISHALARASHWFGLTCLAGALLALLALNFAHRPTATTATAATASTISTTTSAALWFTILALLAMAGFLIELSLRRTVTLTIAYLIVGSGCIYLFTVTILGMPDVFPFSNLFLVALPKLALIMVGGAGTGALAGVLWSTLGFVLAEAVTVLAALQTQVPYSPDPFTISTYLFLVGVLLFAHFARRQAAAQTALHRAVLADRARLLRHDLDQRALARTQDTTLTELVALARAHAGPLSPNLAGSIRATLQTLRGTDWLTDADQRSVEPSAGTDAWLTSEVYAAIERSRDRGLVVEVTGERAALGRLDPVSDRELGLAVQQCLTNVILHSGIVAAEVVIESELDSISLMVMDAGRGFTESETGSDRLGLRQAVRHRIERLGGSVSILTRPGAGTSVLLNVPVPISDPITTDAATLGEQAPR